MIKNEVKQIIKKITFQNKDENSVPPKIILGLSGGPDSVFLFLVLKELHDSNKINLIAAHLDHGWREESIKDLELCQDLCKKNTINLIAENAQNLKLDIKFNGSKEEIGRILRRHFFKQILEQEDAQYIALAHHKQDQQETFFIRLLRGSSIEGLTSMKVQNGPYIRPMLNINKKDILKFLKNNQIDFIQDKTNELDDFLRNRIRKHVIPALKKADARFDKKFESTLQNLQATEQYLQKQTDFEYEKIFCNGMGNLELFNKTDIFMQKRLITKWLIVQKIPFNISHRFLKEILRFINSPRGGQHQISENLTINKKNKYFWT